MASEMRRMAKLLVEHRDEAFASRHARDESMRRVDRALEGFSPKGMVFKATWRDTPGPAMLDVRFAPSRSTRFFLNSASLVLTLMLLGTLWALVAPGELAVGRAAVAIGTLVSILVFPFVVVAYGSRREAEEAAFKRRIRKAIVDEEEPPRKK